MADRDLIVDVAILVSHARQRIEDEICEGARVGRLVHLAPREDSAALERMQPFKKLFAKVWTAYHGVAIQCVWRAGREKDEEVARRKIGQRRKQESTSLAAMALEAGDGRAWAVGGVIVVWA